MIKTPAESIIQEAKHLVLAERICVAFLGSGMSIPPAGDRKELIKRVAEESKVSFEEDADMGTYPELIDKCIKKNCCCLRFSIKRFYSVINYGHKHCRKSHTPL